MAKKKFPLGEVVNVPTNKIVRCRWRDEEDSPDKIRVAVERIGRQGFRGHLDGRPLPDGRVEQLNGHNRKAGCLELGITEIPMMLREYTDEEALDIFLSDNMKEDGQSTGWALGSVRKVIPYLVSTGIAKSEAQARLADKIGLEVSDVKKLAEMNEALDESVLSPAVKRLPVPYNAVEFWRKLQELMKLRFVSLDEQNAIVEKVIAGPDHRRRITNTFSDLLRGEAPLKVVVPRAKTPPFTVACRILQQLADVFQQNDFEGDEAQTINNLLEFVNNIAPAPMTESQKAVAAVLATMQEDENESTTV
jgi:ParB-like nuclease domain